MNIPQKHLILPKVWSHESTSFLTVHSGYMSMTPYFSSCDISVFGRSKIEKRCVAALDVWSFLACWTLQKMHRYRVVKWFPYAHMCVYSTYCVQICSLWTSGMYLGRIWSCNRFGCFFQAHAYEGQGSDRRVAQHPPWSWRRWRARTWHKTSTMSKSIWFLFGKEEFPCFPIISYLMMCSF